jgi:Secretion system C-terminal sorting domain
MKNITLLFLFLFASFCLTAQPAPGWYPQLGFTATDLTVAGLWTDNTGFSLLTVGTDPKIIRFNNVGDYQWEVAGLSLPSGGNYYAASADNGGSLVSYKSVPDANGNYYPILEYRNNIGGLIWAKEYIDLVNTRFTQVSKLSNGDFAAIGARNLYDGTDDCDVFQPPYHIAESPVFYGLSTDGQVSWQHAITPTMPCDSVSFEVPEIVTGLIETMILPSYFDFDSGVFIELDNQHLLFKTITYQSFLHPECSSTLPEGECSLDPCTFFKTQTSGYIFDLGGSFIQSWQTDTTINEILPTINDLHQTSANTFAELHSTNFCGYHINLGKANTDGGLIAETPTKNQTLQWGLLDAFFKPDATSIVVSRLNGKAYVQQQDSFYNKTEISKFDIEGNELWQTHINFNLLTDFQAGHSVHAKHAAWLPSGAILVYHDCKNPAGTYPGLLVLTEEGCVDLACNDSTTFTATMDLTYGKLHLAPNPASNEVILTFDQNLPTDGIVSITNTLGQLVTLESVSAGTKSKTFSVAEFTNGIYYYRLQLTDGTNWLGILVKGE